MLLSRLHVFDALDAVFVLRLQRRNEIVLVPSLAGPCAKAGGGMSLHLGLASTMYLWLSGMQLMNSAPCPSRASGGAHLDNSQ